MERTLMNKNIPMQTHIKSKEIMNPYIAKAILARRANDYFGHLASTLVEGTIREERISGAGTKRLRYGRTKRTSYR